jgi:hypothetical protein
VSELKQHPSALFKTLLRRQLADAHARSVKSYSNRQLHPNKTIYKLAFSTPPAGMLSWQFLRCVRCERGFLRLQKFPRTILIIISLPEVHYSRRLKGPLSRSIRLQEPAGVVIRRNSLLSRTAAGPPWAQHNAVATLSACVRTLHFFTY